MTRPEHLSYCEVEHDLVKFRYRVAVKHNGAVRILEFHDSTRDDAVMREIFATKNEMFVADEVAKKLIV